MVGIPLEKIVGFRAPFLQHDPAQRASLYKNGFTYDRQVRGPAAWQRGQRVSGNQECVLSGLGNDRN